MITAPRIEAATRELAKSNPPIRCRKCKTEHFVVRDVACKGAIQIWRCDECWAVQTAPGVFRDDAFTSAARAATGQQ